MKPAPLGLRARFLGASLLLVGATVAASLVTVLVLSRLEGEVDALVRAADVTTAATSAVATALEREDDALLFILGGGAEGRARLVDARRKTDVARATLKDQLAREPAIINELDNSVDPYRATVDALVDTPTPRALERYHDEVNPHLRAAIAAVARARDHGFVQAQTAVSHARDGVTQARGVVVLIALGAFFVALVVALSFARHMIVPLRALAVGADAIREGKFEHRISLRRGDEIGQLGAAFDEMASRLAEFHRSSLGEVLRAKQTLEAMMRALPDAVLLVDSERRIVSMNPAAEALFRGLKVPTPLTLEDVAKLGDGGHALRKALDLGEPPSTQQVALQSAVSLDIGGMLRRFLPRVAPTIAPDDARGEALLVLSDVTDLARIDDMRTDLIAVASHELGTPVTTLRMTLMMLRESTRDLDPRTRELVSTAIGGVDQLSRTVDELLDVTRLEAGRLTLDLENVDVLTLINEVIEANRQAHGAAHLALHAQLDGAHSVRADRARLRSVIDNLVGNALKYASSDAKIDVEVGWRMRGHERVLEVAVSDDGPGIPAELRTRVFERFFRVEQAKSARGDTPRGSGIGLYLCKEIVELHGGTIRCESTTRGASDGARIVFDIPAAARLA